MPAEANTQSCFCGRPGFDGLIRGLGSLERDGPPTPVFWPREFSGGRKDSDTSGQLFTFTGSNFGASQVGAIGKESACQGRRRERFMGLDLRQESPLKKEKTVSFSVLPWDTSSFGGRGRIQIRPVTQACRVNSDNVESCFLDLICYKNHVIRFHLVLSNCFSVAFKCVHCTSRNL